MQQGRFRHDDMIHHPGAQPYGYVPTLVTRGVDQFCLAGMVWFWKALKDRVAQFSLAKATFEQVVEFSKSLLVDISAAWEIADLDQKQRVQNALFLGGLKYHPKNGILNPDNASLFCQLDNFLGGKMDLVALPGIEPMS
jgi:hypothetical protein